MSQQTYMLGPKMQVAFNHVFIAVIKLLHFFGVLKTVKARWP